MWSVFEHKPQQKNCLLQKMSTRRNWLLYALFGSLWHVVLSTFMYIKAYTTHAIQIYPPVLCKTTTVHSKIKLPYLWVEIWRINLHLIYLVVFFFLMLHVLLCMQTILLLLQWLLTSLVIGIVIITKSLLEICITCAKNKTHLCILSSLYIFKVL